MCRCLALIKEVWGGEQAKLLLVCYSWGTLGRVGVTWGLQPLQGTWSSRVGQLAQGGLWVQKVVSKARGYTLWRFLQARIGVIGVWSRR